MDSENQNCESPLRSSSIGGGTPRYEYESEAPFYESEIRVGSQPLRTFLRTESARDSPEIEMADYQNGRRAVHGVEIVMENADNGKQTRTVWVQKTAKHVQFAAEVAVHHVQRAGALAGVLAGPPIERSLHVSRQVLSASKDVRYGLCIWLDKILDHCVHCMRERRLRINFTFGFWLVLVLWLVASKAFTRVTLVQSMGVAFSILVGGALVRASARSKTRIFITIFVAFLTTISLIYPWVRHGFVALPSCKVFSRQRYDRISRDSAGIEVSWLEVRCIISFIRLVLTSVILMGCVMYWRTTTSPYIQTALHCLVIYWLGSTANHLHLAGIYCEGPRGDVPDEHISRGRKMGFLLFVHFCRAVTLSLEAFTVFNAGTLIVQRIQALQTSMPRSLLLWCMRLTLVIGCWSWFAGIVVNVFCGTRGRKANFTSHELKSCWESSFIGAFFAFTIWSRILSMTIFDIVVLRAFAVPLLLLKAEARRLAGPAHYEAVWAAGALQREATATAGCLIVTYIHLTWGSSMDSIENQTQYKLGESELLFEHDIPYGCQAILNMLCIAALSGLLTREAPRHYGANHGGQSAEIHRQQRLPISKPTPRPAAWEEKVRELASRGFTLEPLLDFYDQLDELMPSFDPAFSTTEDVVRHAVIPCSRTENGGGCAMATVWNEGEPLMAERIVTHTWSNLFVHLVAAMVADGLGQDTYDAVAVKLSLREVDEVKSELLNHGALSNVYWVCALSVNQHASICGIPGSNYNPCDCTEPKYLNDSPVECEMNKFDVMMSFLQENVPMFTQLVAVDKSFKLFTRAWCIAELVEADNLGIPQSMKIFSKYVLDKHYDKMSRLRVEDCEATRAEDKEHIMSKIEDLDRFNEQVQLMIFAANGLFSAWQDATDTMASAGRVAGRALLRASTIGGQRSLMHERCKPVSPWLSYTPSGLFEF